MFNQLGVDVIFSVCCLVFYFFVVALIVSKRTNKYILALLLWHPVNIFAVPLVLTALAIFPVWLRGRLDLVFILATIIYVLIPTKLVFEVGCGITVKNKNVFWREMLAIFCLWLPIEIATTTNWLKYYLGEATHVIGWGVPSLLGLMLFFVFRDSAGMRFRCSLKKIDLINFILGFVAAVIILIPTALAFGFMGEAMDIRDVSLGKVLVSFVWIFFGVALVEEFLFRSLIQNWLMQKFGESNKILFLAAMIFGLSHLNNGPHALPNWRYAIIATFAGFIYGKVFQRSSTIISSAAVHAAVNTARHNFFSKPASLDKIPEWMNNLAAMMGLG